MNKMMPVIEGQLKSDLLGVCILYRRFQFAHYWANVPAGIFQFDYRIKFEASSQ